MATCCAGIDVYIGNKIYDYVAWKFEFVPRNYSIHPEDFDEEASYDPEREKEKEKIMSEHMKEVEATQMNGDLQTKKWVYFMCCNISNFIGIIFTLWGLGATKIFQAEGRNDIILYCSIIFYIPCLMWFRWLFLPTRKEREVRAYIRDRRIWRKAVEKKRKKIFLGMPEDSDEEFESSPNKSAKAAVIPPQSTKSSMRNSSVQLNPGGSPSKKVSIQVPASSSKGPVNSPSVKAPPIAAEPKRSSLRMNDDPTQKKSKRISFSV